MTRWNLYISKVVRVTCEPFAVNLVLLHLVTIHCIHEFTIGDLISKQFHRVSNGNESQAEDCRLWPLVTTLYEFSAAYFRSAQNNTGSGHHWRSKSAAGYSQVVNSHDECFIIRGL